VKNNPSSRLTRNRVNDALRARGRDESLRQGDGFFYFGGGDAVNWLSCTVMVRRISDLTLEQWLAEFDKLVTRDNQLRKQMPKDSPSGKPSKRSRKT